MSIAPTLSTLLLNVEHLDANAANARERANAAQDKADAKANESYVEHRYWAKDAARITAMADREAARATAARERYAAAMADPTPF